MLRGEQYAARKKPKLFNVPSTVRCTRNVPTMTSHACKPPFGGPLDAFKDICLDLNENIDCVSLARIFPGKPLDPHLEHCRTPRRLLHVSLDPYPVKTRPSI